MIIIVKIRDQTTGYDPHEYAKNMAVKAGGKLVGYTVEFEEGEIMVER